MCVYLRDIRVRKRGKGKIGKSRGVADERVGGKGKNRKRRTKYEQGSGSQE